MRIVVVTPAFNEARSIGLVAGDVPRAPFSVEGGRAAHVVAHIVVSNASTDETEANARAAGCAVVREARRGYGQACLTGIAAAAAFDPGIVVFLDGDYSDHPDELPRIVAPIVRGEAVFVVGSRMRGVREPGAMLPQALIGNRLACALMRWIWGVRWTDLGPFRAITWGALAGLGMEDRTYGWTVEMQIRAAAAGLACAEVPVSYRRRVGVSKITGTVSGTAGASWKILSTIARFAVRVPPRRADVRKAKAALGR